MKKKGFTLIELLAVIVILAIIALIATPTILGVIEKAKKGSTESSALGYIDAVEKQIMINEVDSSATKIIDGVYEVSTLKKLGVTIKGETPSNESWVKIEKNQVTDYSLKFKDYTVTYTKVTEIKEIVKKGEVSTKPSGEVTVPIGPTMVSATRTDTHKGIVYLDPTDLMKACNESNSVSTTGTKSGCMKWYIFDNSGDNYTMILDHNTTAKLAYNSSDSNTSMKEVKEALENDTNNWKVPVRLITANEIAKITNHPTFDSSKTGQIWYCLATNKQDYDGASPYCNKETNISMNWLFDYTYCKEGSNDWGCSHNDTSTYGYWTSTPYTGSSSIAWGVNGLGTLDNLSVSITDRGVRPVITISKDIIK